MMANPDFTGKYYKELAKQFLDDLAVKDLDDTDTIDRLAQMLEGEYDRGYSQGSWDELMD